MLSLNYCPSTQQIKALDKYHKLAWSRIEVDSIITQVTLF